ncbi:Nn.00g035930.m01.CDS01 [Neocucurbitaria sp. VM-36]
MSSDNWMHFSTHQPKRKRAELVCITCHAKKVKCDIQIQKRQGNLICTNCSSSGRECRIRPSKREKRRKVVIDEGGPGSTTGQMSDGVDALLAADATFHALELSQAGEGSANIDPGLEHNHLSPTTSLQNIRIQDFQRNTSPGSIFASAQNQSPISQRQQNSVSHAGTTPTQIGDVDSGFLGVYGPENQLDADNQAFVAQLEHKYRTDLHPDLQQIFTDTYFTYCYTWCPVLDRETLSSEIARSPLLANALALASSHIQPPLLPHDGPEAYYKRARSIFYDDEEADSLTSLKALCLFYWWAPQAPSRVHRHSSWWWTSVIIRHAQQMNIHREPMMDDAHRDRMELGLRRRIWWTAFARERLTSLCQSKPVIIDPDDCNIQEPTLADFPKDLQSQRQGEVFIYWVRLCAIIGRIAKVLLQSDKSITNVFPNHLREELVSWVHSLPPRLRLPIESARTDSFDRDVHQLHLFYLTTIVIMHLKRSGGHLPQALPPAIIAASCTARILRDILARGNSRFLMAITCWHVGTAFIALLQACRIEHLAKFANDDLDILCHTVKQLQQMWASANVVAQGFDRLRKPGSNPTYSGTTTQNQTRGSSFVPQANVTTIGHTNGTWSNRFDNGDDEDDFDWLRFFPFVSKSTNGIVESLISGKEQGTATRGFPSPNNELFHDTLLAQYQDLFDPFTDYTLGFGVPDFMIPAP